ncbi:AAA family ATPase [Lysinibacillus sp. NPDC097162]|uniref:AAA family ATPase n=1 Tax=Lysinibacillus sp. NPDC097162 TaxID=3364140 RepID=UPI0038118853
MKKIELVVLKLRDFKGIKSLDIQLDGGNAEIFGDNEAGKTTTFDAFLWLLFDKDSNNKKDFAIKTLNGDGTDRHNLEHTVEGSFLIDGVPVTLKKIYKEKWTKKRGQAVAEFTGHVVEHFVDDVPMSKKDYTAKVESIVDEEVFKLLTSPTYFNEQMKWQDRRALLIEICGDISDEDVIVSNQSLAKLNDLLNGKSMEDMKKIIASQKKHINEELEKIPVRIDEINKMMPETTVDIEKMRQQVEQIEAEMDELQQQKIRVKNGESILTKQRQLQELEMKQNDLKRSFESDSLQEVHKLQVRLQEAKGNVQIIQSEIRMNEVEKQSIGRDIQAFTGRIMQNEASMQKLREEFASLNALTFEYSDECECPTCKQALPTEQVEAVRAEALAQFNERISKRKAEIKAEGPVFADENTQIQAQIQTKNEKLNSVLIPKSKELNEKLAAAEKELAKFNEKLQQAQASVPDVTTTDTYQAIVSQKQALQAEIQQLNEHANEAIAGIDQEILGKRGIIGNLNSEIAQHANIEASKERIIELEDQQVKLAQEYEKLEQTTFLIEEFIRTKVNMLTERINSKFKYARFKLFDTQVNGGLNEVCETTYKGVPYGTGLNNAAKINVGLDIINTLSAHYGILAPIFVDNAEAVTKFIDVETQLISLVVSEKDKQLRVELEPIEYKEAI